MKSRPIIFSTESVMAILEGRKTQTRRVIKPQPIMGETLSITEYWTRCDSNERKCPCGVPGDRLWVRETWRPRDPSIDDCCHVDYCTCPRGEDYRYASDYSDAVVQDYGPWKSPMFMPKSASRITLEIVDVKVQKLQDIRERELRAEGYCSEGEFMRVFNKLNKEKYPDGLYDNNPWVWAIEFKRIEPCRNR